MLLINRNDNENVEDDKKYKFNISGFFKKKGDEPKPIQEEDEVEEEFNYSTMINDEERYTSFATECISLQNSEMSNFEEPSRKPQQQPPERPPIRRNLKSLLRIGSFTNHNIYSTNPHHTEEDYSDSESDLNFDPKHEENEDDYKVGGYHPVTKGETYYSKKNSYLILRKLGWGHFSTVWLAKQNEDNYVAVKFVKSNKNYTEAARDEIRIMKTLNDPIKYYEHLPERYLTYFENHDSENVMKLLDDFEITGPHGSHICMVFEILGENILNLIYNYKKFYKSLDTKIQKKGEEIKFTKKDTIMKSTKSMLSLGLKENSISPVETEEEEEIEQKLNSMNSESLVKLMETSKNVGGIPLTLVKQITKQMLLAVNYIHHCGVIHTDLKPENILIDIKDINKIIKTIEDKKPPSRRTSIFRKNSTKQSSSLTRTLSTSSQSSFYYKKKYYDSPVRSSKPFSTSVSSEILFNDVDYTKSVSKAISPRKFSFDEPKISIKIADFGNATFTDEHFTNQIQTRQYRSPEIIMRYKSWGASTDLWSIGCIIFELITGEFLFDPHDGKFFDKDEDHLAQIIELLGHFPNDEYLVDCKLTSKFFKLHPEDHRKIIFKNIDNLKYWDLKSVLIEKYKFDKNDIEVELISDLILKCLKFELNERFDANSLLQHPWFEETYGLDSIERAKAMTNEHDDLPGYIDLCKE
ncbi:unnamed protein product [Candida verbasci]|uniref:non-specific serine/threonine protein kinase n=1 Tax=Candida verbasci TaxID=1227364 RepID=A0A9W4TX72_9ASCO|nr:unnamed protein product [Candida verbasci]